MQVERHADDIHVFLRAKGKTSAEPHFFVTLNRVRRVVEDGQDWLWLEFEEGGTIRYPLYGKGIWVEPERQ